MYSSATTTQPGLRALLKLVVFGRNSGHFTTDELIYVQDAQNATPDIVANLEEANLPSSVLKKPNRSRFRQKLEAFSGKFQRKSKK